MTRLAKAWSFHLTEMAESQNIEWKHSWQDEYLKWVCGFANAHGGTISIGKDDEGSIVHLKDSKKLLVDIPGKIRLVSFRA